MQNAITIYGAKTLDRYTNLILLDGFKNNFWKAIEGKIIVESLPPTPYALYQIHGSPQAIGEDKVLMEMIKKTPAETKVAILLHRPDEIQQIHQELKEILAKASANTPLVFVGDKHINDEFYKNVSKKFIIPHGFFDVKEKLQKDPIIIGTHTTWGEMRSVEHALKIILEVFRLNNKTNIVGYLGGTPINELRIDNLKKMCKNINHEIEILFLDCSKYTPTEALKEFPNKNIILVNAEDKQPEGFGTTFNIQAYYYSNKIRTGESSGSIHMSVSIPVVLEMNGSEIIEDLQVIKIPYSSVSDINSADFEKGAQMIVRTINDGSYIKMLEHNLQQAKKFNNTFVAKSYIDIFSQP